MGLTKYKLGELISLCDERNTNNVYSLKTVKGISIKKEFIETKADMAGVSLTPYILVCPDSFAYVTVTSRNGEKITLAHNTSSDTYIVSSSYVVFRICRPDLLLSDYLFIFFNRPEFDRYSRFNSWGSARETFSWEDFCNTYISLPDIDIQKKYVEIYLSLQNNLAVYQSKVDELKLVCDGYIEDLRKMINCERIGPYITRESKNTEGLIKRVLGIGQDGFMMPQKDPNESLRNYKLLNKGDIAYAPPLFNMLTGALHCYNDDVPAVCSPIYEVFKCNQSRLLPEYLTLWLKRNEFIRYAEFYAIGVRQTFDYSLMEDFKIPIPELSVQRSIVNIFKAYLERKTLCKQLENNIKNICPVLLQGSLQS